MITGHYVNITERGLTSDWGEISAIIRSVVHSRFTHEINCPVHELRVQSRYLIVTFCIFTIVTSRTLHLAVNVVTFSAEETGWGSSTNFWNPAVLKGAPGPDCVACKIFDQAQVTLQLSVSLSDLVTECRDFSRPAFARGHENYIFLSGS
jgi:hypothetical protein